MNERSKSGLEILQAAILLGILCDVLLRHTPWGLNVSLVVSVLAAAMVMLLWRRKREFWSPASGALIAATVLCGLGFAWRDSIELKMLNSAAIFIILAVLVLPALRIDIRSAGVYHYAIGFFWSGVNAAFSPFLVLFNDIEWSAVSREGWKKHFVSVLRGAAIAAPLLFIFGALFVAADAVFQGIVERTLNIRADLILQHGFMIGFFSWIAAGYLRGVITESLANDVKSTFLEKTEASEPIPSITTTVEESNAEETKTDESKWDWRQPESNFLPATLTIGPIEVGVAMGLINLLFLLFVIVQIPYLFGGFELVQQTENLKLADYARRGFGELVTVAALVLPTLLFSHWLLRKESPAAEKLYRVMAGIQLALLFVIMASAAQRLFVLTGNLGYGLTTVRFYPMVFMIWLAVVFIWFAITVLRGKRSQFAWGALWSALCVLGILHLINPNEFIVRTNIALMREGRSFDVQYNSNLSDDAIPLMLESFPSLGAAEPLDSIQSRMKTQLGRRLCEIRTETDLRSFNLARWRAKRAFDVDKNWVEFVGNCEQFDYRRGFD
ncbi:MAG: DUF4173 domain-containing protein [Acidobacteria bacterium]|nr:DUF4173 domain-containing protein [Acidobacteriota bacterium]